MASQGHLSHSDFFSRLSDLLNLQQGKDHGSIYLTQKRISHDPDTASSSPAHTPKPALFDDLNPENPLPIVVRATNGKGKRSRDKKVKLSTVVQPDDIDAFFIKYADICKAGMLGLKKRDRKGRRTNKAKKKKAGADGEVKS